MRAKTYDELYERLDEAIGDLVYLGASETEIRNQVEGLIEEAIARHDQAMIDRYIEEKGPQ